MKKISLVTIGVTGALILTTAATALAAPSVEKEQAKNDTQTILNSSTAKSAPTELPEKFQDLEFPEGITLPEKEQETEADSRKPFAGSEGSDSDNKKPFVEGSRFKSAFVPKLKPETKPEVEDRVPPEYEGVENIDQLGRPEFSERPVFYLYLPAGPASFCSWPTSLAKTGRLSRQSCSVPVGNVLANSPVRFFRIWPRSASDRDLSPRAMATP